MSNVWYISADSKSAALDATNEFLRERAFEGEVWTIDSIETEDDVTIYSLSFVKELPSE